MCFWTECSLPIGSEPLCMFRIERIFVRLATRDMFTWQPKMADEKVFGSYDFSFCNNLHALIHNIFTEIIMLLHKQLKVNFMSAKGRVNGRSRSFQAAKEI